MASRLELLILQKLDQELLVELKRASSSINRQIKGLNTKQVVKKTRLLVIQRDINKEISKLWKSVGSITQTKRADAAVAAIENSLKIEYKVFPKDLHKYLEKNSRQGIDALQARLKISKQTLSQRIYRSYTLQTGVIDRLINNAIATQMSEEQLAEQIRQYVNPDAPGGVSYSAKRLARTEIGNAYHAAMIQRALTSPAITALRWILAGSHKTPDQCNDYAGKAFKPEKCPLKPHPLCLCTIEPIVKFKL
jgi:SPP1 gp7 family putative phage head morphogenesis protein